LHPVALAAMAARKELEEWFASNGNNVEIVKLKEVLKRIDPLYSEPNIDLLFEAAGYAKDGKMTADEFMKLFFGEKPPALPISSGFKATKAKGVPEVIYFNGPGRGELARLCFAAGGVEFTDTRVEQPNWPAMKGDAGSVPAKMFGSIPCIKHGDFLLAQSAACSQYAADCGINSKNNPSADERALDTMMLGAHADLQAACYKCLFGDDASKAAGKEALAGSTGSALAGCERAYARGSGPFLYGKDGPTLGDLALFDLVSSPFPGLPALGVDMSGYPKLNAMVDAVKADANVKAYCAKRGF